MKELRFKEIKQVEETENNEPLVNGNNNSTNVYFADQKRKISDGLEAYNLQLDIIRSIRSPDSIYCIRENTAKMLGQAAENLRKGNNQYRLVLAYGFRPTEIQHAVLTKVCNSFRMNKSIRLAKPEDDYEDEYSEQLNQIVSLPEVAGHPTGGTVDVTIWEWDKTIGQGRYLDMGYPLLDIDKDPIEMSSKASKLSIEQQRNRQLLLETMTDQGFAPYWGKWWQFSFGDKEWAKYYSTPYSTLKSIYKQRSYSEGKELYYQKFNPLTLHTDLFDSTKLPNRYGR